MTRLGLWLIAGHLALIAPPLWADEPAPLTLDDCYRLALIQSETIAIHQELIAEAEARFTRAASGLLPRASFVSSDKVQDGHGGSAFTLRHVPERKFTLSQPLFSGFREFAAMAGSRAERRQRASEKIRAEQLLLMDVVEAFTRLLESREDLAALEATRAALVERLDELAARVALGRSRPSEMVSAEAQRLRLEGDLEAAHSRELVTRHLLEFLTGRDPIGALQPIGRPPPRLEEERVYLARALGRPDLAASEQAREVAGRQVALAKAGYWPEVTADGTYYVERVGVAKDVAWDATVTVDVPLFEGGQTRGAVQEAEAQHRQASLRSDQARRGVLLDVRDEYAAARAALAQAQAVARAFEAADDNYRLQAEDYRHRLVNNLEVLQALQQLETARRDAIHTRHEAQRAVWRLRVAAGETLGGIAP